MLRNAVTTVLRSRSAAHPSWPRDAGLTLIELLVVLSIIALLAGLAAPQVMRYLGTARSETAKSQVASLVSAVELYYLDMGAYPPQDAGLKVLMEAPAGTQKWSGPYLKKGAALTDPWGKPYAYRVPGRQAPFEIYSLGRDGQEGGTGEDKDITSW